MEERLEEGGPWSLEALGKTIGSPASEDGAPVAFDGEDAVRGRG